MALDLVPLWTILLGLAVFYYVVFDGFDLGVGMLYGLVRGDAARATVMNSIAPVWDGNETWLIFGGLGLLTAFPLAFAIIIPAVYFPILMMLLALVFRGVAFEFRFKHLALRRLWDGAFCGGSLVATFAQGVVLGAFIEGFKVDGRQFAGSSFDWLAPFPLAIGLALTFGYGLLGACWLILKTEGELQDWARRAAGICLLAVLVAIAGVSIWTPLAHPDIARRWFTWPNIAFPFACADRHRVDCAGRMGSAPAPSRIDAVPWCHRAILDVVYRHRDQLVADDRAIPLYAMAGGFVRQHAGLSPNWYALPATNHSDVHGLVLLGVPRQGPRRPRVSLRPQGGCRVS